MTTHSARPPMGWNSWDCYGTTVTEEEVLANARFMSEYLLPYGWDMVVVDIDWSDPTAREHGYNVDAPLAMDAWGRLIPDERRFPSSAAGAGFRPLADKVHALGLRFGIHAMRGVPRRAVGLRTPVRGTEMTAADVADSTNVCEWNPDMLGLDHAIAAAQAYYDSVFELYAAWGVDLVKADDMLWPYQAADITAIARAIERCGRPIQLSLSPGRDLSLTRLDHLRQNATMWRICDDLWDRWEDVEANLARFARWAPHASAAGWPDGDMLPLGRIGIRAERGEPRDDNLTAAERQFVMTLWVIARSPLMIGGDLPSSDPATVALFTNAEVLEVHRDSSGNREVFREDPLVLWTAEGRSGVRYVAAFNVGDEPLDAVVDPGNIDLPLSGGELRELWTGTTSHLRPVAVQSDEARGVAPGSAAVDLRLDAHGAALLRWTPEA